MVNIILASHGHFAESLLETSHMIFGEQEQVSAVSLLADEGPEDIAAKIKAAINDFDNEDDMLFLVDLWGGTPFNQVNAIHEERIESSAIISGINLPLFLEILGNRLSTDSAHEIATKVMDPEISGIRVKPGNLVPITTDKKYEVKQSNGGSLPEGTVLGDGKIEYGLVRIDTRLLHGQVATGWVQAVRPTRIIVVSDKVAHDDMRKSLIKEASPSGIPAHTIPIKKFVEIDKDPRFGDTKAMVLFESPQDLLTAIDAGVEFDEVNLGSMAHTMGKVMITNALSVDSEDVKVLKEIKDRGINFDVRRVPTDSPANLEKLLQKENLI